MTDLRDYGKRYERFVEPLWWFYTKQFLKGFWKAFKYALMVVFLLVFTYLLVFFGLANWKETGKQISGQCYQEKSNYDSTNVTDFKKLIIKGGH